VTESALTDCEIGTKHRHVADISYTMIDRNNWNTLVMVSGHPFCRAGQTDGVLARSCHGLGFRHLFRHAAQPRQSLSTWLKWSVIIRSQIDGDRGLSSQDIFVKFQYAMWYHLRSTKLPNGNTSINQL